MSSAGLSSPNPFVRLSGLGCLHVWLHLQSALNNDSLLRGALGTIASCLFGPAAATPLMLWSGGPLTTNMTRLDPNLDALNVVVVSTVMIFACQGSKVAMILVYFCPFFEIFLRRLPEPTLQNAVKTWGLQIRREEVTVMRVCLLVMLDMTALARGFDRTQPSEWSHFLIFAHTALMGLNLALVFGCLPRGKSPRQMVSAVGTWIANRTKPAMTSAMVVAPGVVYAYMLWLGRRGDSTIPPPRRVKTE